MSKLSRRQRSMMHEALEALGLFEPTPEQRQVIEREIRRATSRQAFSERLRQIQPKPKEPAHVDR